MTTEEIKSRKNPLVRAAAELKGSAQKRREKGLFLCEGARLCRDAALYGTEIAACLFTARAEEKYGEYLKAVLPKAEAAYRVTEPVADLLADTLESQGVFCLCRSPKGIASWEEMPPGGPCVVLENLQDPGNLGAVLRTAEALGVTRTVLAGASPDPLSPKVLRASMGAVLRCPLYLAEDVRALSLGLRAMGYTQFAAVVDRDALSVHLAGLSRTLSAVWIGNEGAGLSETARSLCDRAVTIPMPGRAESLNASAAATVLLWELCRRGKEGEDG